MASLNHTVLIGNMTHDPELKQTTGGTSVCNFSIAVNRPFVSDKKENVQDVDFFNVVAWGKTAEFVAAYFPKGEPMFVRGRLQSRSWTDNNNVKRYTVELVADEVSFVRSKPQAAAQESSTADNSKFSRVRSDSSTYPSPDFKENGPQWEEIQNDEEVPF